MDIKSYHTDKRHKRIKLIFNPASGEANHSPIQLTDIVRELEAWKFKPEVFVLSMNSDLPKLVEETISRGIRFFAACGGDGTVNAVAKALEGRRATLGILPMGTQNNIALSLGIPPDILKAISVLRNGKQIKTDIGMAICENTQTAFLEICSIGLMSSLFPSGDDIQHGHLDKIGDFLAKFATCAPSKIKLLLDGRQEIITTGHVVLVSNMPYIGRHYQVGDPLAYRDGYLDLLLCSSLSKLDLVGCAFKEGARVQDLTDPRIQRYRVRRAEIDTNPGMAVMADGTALGEGAVHVEIHPRALAVMAPNPEQGNLTETQEAASI